MHLYASEDFTLAEDFEDVKRGLVWLAERVLPVGVWYQIWYDPDTRRAFGVLKSLHLHTGRDFNLVEEEHTPPLYIPQVGLYHVLTRKASGEPPALHEEWKARKQLRYLYAEKASEAIEEARRDDQETSRKNG